MAGSRSKTSDPSYYDDEEVKKPEPRKVDVFAGKGSVAGRLRERREMMESMGDSRKNPYMKKKKED